MPSYVFSVNKVEVHNNRSKGQHNDSDWLSLYLKLNDKVQTAGPFNIGPNIHSGDVLTGPWTLGPAQISNTDNVSLSYTVVNLGHEDDINVQAGQAIQVTTGVAGGILAAFPPVGTAVGIALAALGQVLGWVIGLDKSNPNCNGEVLRDTFEYPPGVLIQRGTPHTVSNDYTENTPSECGNPPQTTVIYSVVDASSVRQFMMIHGLDPSMGFRHIQPPVTSLKAFMSH
jgi:hypothetical protein